MTNKKRQRMSQKLQIFSTVGFTMASQIQSPKMPLPKQMKCLPSFFLFGETDPEEINQLISEPNEKIAVRKDDIAIKYYKIAKSVISPIISKMINKCISQGSFPDCLKIAQVIPYQFIKKDQKLTVVTIVQFPSYLLYQKSLKKLCLLDYVTILKKTTFI